MTGKKYQLPSISRSLGSIVLGTALFWGTVEAREYLNGGTSAKTTPNPAASVPGTGTATAPAVATGQDRLEWTNQALAAVKQMQMAAHNFALAGPNNLKTKLLTNLSEVPVNSYLKINGLAPATGVPKDLLNPTVGEDATLWTGAKLPTEVLTDPRTGKVVTTSTATTQSTISIVQTDQQAVLNWDSFNVGKNTTLNFDQSAGGTNVGQWIAFNKVGVTGAPSQILGAINTIGAGPADSHGNLPVGGQVYVINPNGIIFGGSSQVNTHALVASSLPINDNLIKRGLLNNPDAQFLFSALPQDAGANTAAFTPVIADEFSAPADVATAHVLAMNPATGSVPVVSVMSAGTAAGTLKAGVDYNLSDPDAQGKVSLNFTSSGLTRAAGATVHVSYTPAGDQYGDVEVQPGALLTAPTTVDHIGGRMALVGSNVSNAGTISTEDGQTILAAGLQVAFTQHNSADATLRGLDTYVGAVADPASLPADATIATTTTAPDIGTVTNAKIVNADKTVDTGLIEAARGAVTLTGKTLNQNGFIDSSTSVAYNGRVDLVAGYNAVANPSYDPSLDASADFTLALPFIYQSNVGNGNSAAAVPNTGRITLGEDSILRIMPESSTDRIAGDLALPSQVNIQGQSVDFGKNSMVLVPGAAVPINAAFGADGRALKAGVSIRAGAWYTPLSSSYDFVHSDDSQQIYLDEGAVIDVAGSSRVKADVSENIISVELRGSELANSPLQRDGPLRGQTIQVDLRKHGDWDPSLNNGLGGYTWIGTPLADTSGWLALTTHSVGELTVNGGSVALEAGGAVVLHTGSILDVSGGSIDYRAGYTQTSQVSAGGYLYDISQATPDRKYDGIYSGTASRTDPKWGVTVSTTNPLSRRTPELDYVQGGNGGSLSISSPVVALDGAMLGNTVTVIGAGQRALSPLYDSANPPNPAKPMAIGEPGWLVGALSRPIPSEFSLTIGRQHQIEDGSYHDYSPTPANIVFTDTSALPAADEYTALGDLMSPTNYLFPAKRKYELDLSPTLFSNDAGSGFGIVRINNSDDAVGSSQGIGVITVKAGTALTLDAGASLGFDAGNISIGNGAMITAVGGNIVLDAYDHSPSFADAMRLLTSTGYRVPAEDVPQYDKNRGNITIGAGAILNVAGGTADDERTSSAAGTQPLLTQGGKITVKGSNVTLAPTSALDVSGGAQVSSTGKIAYGDAGKIALQAGVDSNSSLAVVGGSLDLTGAVLRGFTGLGKKGGTLSMQAPAILINETETDDVSTDVTGKLSFAPRFFENGGFATFSLTGLGVALDTGGNLGKAQPAVVVADKTILQPAVQNWSSLPGESVYLAPAGIRKPVNLALATVGPLTDVNRDELGNSVDLSVEKGSAITTEAGGSVTLSGGTIDVLGSITAPAGSIAVTQTTGYTSSLKDVTVHFGADSALTASGATAYKVDIVGDQYKAGVLDGGKISISGNIVAEKGSVFDVSGSGDIILAPAGTPQDGLPANSKTDLVSQTKESNGGEIDFSGNRILFVGSTLLGGAGDLAGDTGTLASNGTLTVTSKRGGLALDVGDNVLPAPTDPVLILSAATPAFSYDPSKKQVSDANGKVYGDVNGLGQLWFGADAIDQGKFGSVTLSADNRGAIKVQGKVSLAADRQINFADGGVLSFVADSTTPAVNPSLTLTAPYVQLGLKFPNPQTVQSNPLGSNVASTHGTGMLTVNASTLIDVGTLSLQNTGTVALDATYDKKSDVTSGAIRGNGTVDVAGDITLKAGQIYPPTAVTFNVIASDYTLKGDLNPTPGSITVLSAGNVTPLALPLSGGASLNLYASTITQGGTLRAPLGTIRLGAGDDSGVNPLSGVDLPVASKLTLQAGSVTSVSALDPVTGAPVTIPYGINLNGDTWIDPNGNDITSAGPLLKSIQLNADAIDLQAAKTGKAAAVVDVAGGGDLSAYRFVPGTGGKTDILLGITAGSFAIVPDYPDTYAPLATFNSDTNAKVNLGNDTGYVVNAKLGYQIGDRVHIDLQNGKGPQDYTLLPARYVLLPGAYLVTPQTAAFTSGPASSVAKPDGSVLVAGYRFNGLDNAGLNQSLYGSFEVASQSVVMKRAEYQQYSANSFFTDLATANDATAPRLPMDAGQLSLLAGTALNLQGTVLAKAAGSGRGGLIDISSSADIEIGSQTVISGLMKAGTSDLVLLDAAELSSFGAESLLIGGVRSAGVDAATVTVKTNNVTVDNAGEALTGPDVILVANENLALKKNAEIGRSNEIQTSSDPLNVVGSVVLSKVGDAVALDRGGTAIRLPGGTGNTGLLTATSSGTITNSDGSIEKFDATTDGIDNTFQVSAGGSVTLDGPGNITFADSGSLLTKPIAFALGDGALVRVSSDPSSRIVRSGVISSTAPLLTVETGVKIAGTSAALDSTHTTDLAAKIDLSAVKNLSLDSGSMSVLLDKPGTDIPTTGFVLSRDAQQSLLQSATSLSLLSYSTLDLYGSGTFGASSLDSLALHAGTIRGHSDSSDSATGADVAGVIVTAKSITLDNVANAPAVSAGGISKGSLTFDTGILKLGGNQLETQNFAAVAINATGSVIAGDSAKLATKTGGLKVTGGDLTITTPLLTGASATDQSIVADGNFNLLSGKGATTASPGKGATTASPGLGAKLSLVGGTVAVETAVHLPSGSLTVEAKTGGLTITDGNLDVGGTAQHFYEVSKYTDGGNINLLAAAGDMEIKAGSTVSVAANDGGGSAGALSVSVSHGHFTIDADTLSGQAGKDGQGGSFNLDTLGIGSDPATSQLATLGKALAGGGFDRSVGVRVRQGDIDVDGTIRAHQIVLSADQGSVTVTGTLDASGLIGATRDDPHGGTMNMIDPTGGNIALSASGNVVIDSTAWLSAVGYAYNDAGKGGSISLSAGGYTVDVDGTAHVDNGAKVDVRALALIDLDVLHKFTPTDLVINPGVPLPISDRTDLFTGTLHLRETQTAFGDGTQFSNLGTSVSGASSIVLEGYQVFDLADNGGVIDLAVQKAVKDNGTAFIDSVNPVLFQQTLFHVQPGAEIVNNDGSTGDIELTKNWDLSTYRFVNGTSSEPGNLTLRAKGNLIFDYAASLSDGFASADAILPAFPLWTAKLMSDRSWSYRLVAGADYGAANSTAVLPLATLDAVDPTTGSVLIGQGTPTLDPTSGSRTSIISKYFQTIRTGTGDITIAAGRDVQLLNPLATIYTAGRQAEPIAGFDVPVLNSTRADSSSTLFPYYVAQYGVGGGDVTINAQNDIARYRETDDGLVADSSQQMPTNWLYRRGNVGADGKFSALTGSIIPTMEIQSTSWWIDFSNFFSDTGALGGGNVVLDAGRTVSNINAAAPTNARMPGKDADGKPVAPDASKLVEFGGGDVTVRAGADIDGGVYYVERGTTSLSAGGQVKTNASRTTDPSGLSATPADLLATTFFLGKGKIDVTAGGDVLLGTVANPFWLPQGSNNRAYEKTYFSTYDPADSVTVASLGGSITLQGKPDGASDTGVGESAGWLQAWYANVLSADTTGPWLRLAGASALADGAIYNFNTVAEVRPGTFEATAFGGDINLLGQLTFAPSPTGSLDLLAASNINGFGINGALGSSPLYGSAVINLSDADPARLPGPASPLSFASYSGLPDITELNPVNVLFAESGTTTLSLEQKLALHGQQDVAGDSGKTSFVPLHYQDSDPLRLYATGGDLSGLTLYSAKFARVVADNDISDVALYLQNVRSGDSTVVAAGHDIVAYDPTSALRTLARKTGGILNDLSDNSTAPASGTPTAGDIQIAGPGTLQVLAGRNLDLGSGSIPTKDGTAVGITSVGSIRNPYLPQNSGASIFAVAGAGHIYTPASASLSQIPGLATTDLKFTEFVTEFLDPASSAPQASRYLPVLGKFMNLTTPDNDAIWAAFDFKPNAPLTEKQAELVLQVYYRVLRDSARDRNDATSPDFGTYKNGFAAIQALFPGSPIPTEEDIASTVPIVRPDSPWSGALSMSTRLIKTFEGGDISLLVPGGNVTVGRATDPQKPDQGILTERGGGISIFAADNVDVGTSRIFTLRGGNELAWSTWGNIAAGSGSKTVFSAPPTRVLVDPQSGDVQNDLAGLATGSGIGVLATLSGVKPGDVDLIAPVGTIDAGDAGIRSSGNLNLAARVVLNASNIQVGGSSAGTPPPPPAPNIGALAAASTASAGASNAATDVSRQNSGSTQATVLPSLISVEVLGYGGGDDDDDEADKKKRHPASLSDLSNAAKIPVRT